MGSATLRGFEPRHTTSDRQRSLLPSAESIVQCSLVLCLAPVVGVSPSRHFSASAPNIFVWGIPRKIKSKTVSCCKSSQQRYQSSFCTIDCRHHAELQIRMLIWVQDGEQSRSEPWVLQRCGFFEPRRTTSDRQRSFFSSQLKAQDTFR